MILKYYRFIPTLKVIQDKDLNAYSVFKVNLDHIESHDTEEAEVNNKDYHEIINTWLSQHYGFVKVYTSPDTNTVFELISNQESFIKEMHDKYQVEVTIRDITGDSSHE